MRYPRTLPHGTQVDTPEKNFPENSIFCHFRDRKYPESSQKNFYANRYASYRVIQEKPSVGYTEGTQDVSEAKLAISTAIYSNFRRRVRIRIHFVPQVTPLGRGVPKWGSWYPFK